MKEILYGQKYALVLKCAWNVIQRTISFRLHVFRGESRGILFLSESVKNCFACFNTDPALSADILYRWTKRIVFLCACLL